MNLNFTEIRKKIAGIASNKKETEILIRRFGIDREKPETLESIGFIFKVTRERIRQIEKSFLKKIGNSSVLNDFFSEIENFIEKNGGIVSTNIVERNFKAESFNDKAFLKIILEASARFKKINNYIFDESWMVSKYSINLFTEISKEIELFLIKEKRTLNPNDLLKSNFSDNLSADAKKMINISLINSLANSSKKLGCTAEGEIGLMEWGVVNPKNTRDKAYIILRKVKKPLHYKKITEMIKDANFSKRMVSTEAVHNELIRDKRFILVGRGIYALKEWGYKTGTVADVICDILKEEGSPLHKNEIIKKVLEKRVVKKNTILLNLQEKPQFERVKRGVYKLGESK